MKGRTTVSWIEVEIKPKKANQNQSQVHASPRNDAHAHIKCIAVILSSTTHLRLTKKGRIETDARVAVLPLLLQYALVPIFGRVATRPSTGSECSSMRALSIHQK